MPNVIPSITYDCPYCLQHYVVWEPSKGAISDAKYKAFQELVSRQEEIGRCKHCKRQDPNIPTTLEMDGLFTEEDIKDRFFVMKPCIDCGKFTKQDTRKPDERCACGGEMTKNSTYYASLRTYRPDRKITAADRKKMGA